MVGKILSSAQAGLVLVILSLATLLTILAGTHPGTSGASRLNSANSS